MGRGNTGNTRGRARSSSPIHLTPQHTDAGSGIRVPFPQKKKHPKAPHLPGIYIQEAHHECNGRHRRALGLCFFQILHSGKQRRENHRDVDEGPAVARSGFAVESLEGPAARWSVFWKCVEVLELAQEPADLLKARRRVWGLVHMWPVFFPSPWICSRRP